MDGEGDKLLADANHQYGEKFRAPLVRKDAFPRLFDVNSDGSQIRLLMHEAAPDQLAAPMAVTPCRTLRSRPTPPRARTRAASGVAAPPRSRQWQRGLKKRQRRAPPAPPQRRVLRNRRRPCTWTCAPRWPKCPWHNCRRSTGRGVARWRVVPPPRTAVLPRLFLSYFYMV